MLDLLVGMFLLVSSPILIWLQGRKWVFLRNVLRLLTGRSTLVSYGQEESGLPKLRPGLLTPADAHPWLNLDARTVRHLDFLYARDYALEKDIRILVGNLRRLDR